MGVSHWLRFLATMALAILAIASDPDPRPAWAQVDLDGPWVVSGTIDPVSGAFRLSGPAGGVSPLCTDVTVIGTGAPGERLVHRQLHVHGGRGDHRIIRW